MESEKKLLGVTHENALFDASRVEMRGCATQDGDWAISRMISVSGRCKKELVGRKFIICGFQAKIELPHNAQSYL